MLEQFLVGLSISILACILIHVSTFYLRILLINKLPKWFNAEQGSYWDKEKFQIGHPLHFVLGILLTFFFALLLVLVVYLLQLVYLIGGLVV